MFRVVLSKGLGFPPKNAICLDSGIGEILDAL
jgi:hypothetical protein